MSELDQTIEELEAEVLAELEEANGADAPKKGSVPAEGKKKLKTVGNAEVQDGGKAVVEPDAASSPTDIAADKASEVSGDAQQKGEGKPDPMQKIKKVKEAAHKDDEEEEDEEDEEEDEDMSKDEMLTAMAHKMKGMNKEDLHAAYGSMMSGMHEEADEDEVAEAVEMHIQNIDITADVEALVAGEDLSEEFMQKAATIFEAAVKSKTREEVTRIVEEQQLAIAEEVDEYKQSLAEKVDQYLDYVVEEWMKENELAIERGLKGEIAEDFISGLKQLFEDHYIDVPDERYDVLEAQSEKIAELEEQLNSTMESNIQMNSANSELVREQVIAEVASDLTDTEVEKFASLVEDVDFGDEDGFRAKLDTLKENYFPKVENLEETFIHDEDDYGSAAQDIDTSDTMKAYLSAIGRVETRINGR
jgi:hypothetical protein|tara:strand:- start:669 stop:1922 length:1254 start_codon:yes stop_codon:yes gene_type:complete